MSNFPQLIYGVWRLLNEAGTAVWGGDPVKDWGAGLVML